MNIVGTQYTLKTKAFEIYVAGCNGSPHCEDCHNPDSWNFNQGDLCNEAYINKMIDTIRQYDSLIENIMIFGGEPLDQDINELNKLLNNLSYKTKKKLWLFTRYSLQDVPLSIRQICDYIKCGKYEKTKRVDSNIQYGINLATSNQRIYKKGVNY